MAWPSGTKAGTTNVDQGSDKIRLARPDIKQNIDNTNAIIDTFTNMGSPSNNDVLVYNGSSFSPTSSTTFGSALLAFNGDLASGNYQQYSGGFTITGGTHLGITAGAVDSAGQSTFHLPQGTYNIFNNPVFTGVYGSGTVASTPTVRFEDADPDSAGEATVFTLTGNATGFYFRVFHNNIIVTLNKDHDLYVESDVNTGGGSYTMPTILINRIA